MGSYLVIGMGRFGSAVATELYRRKHDVLIIDEQEENVSEIVDQVTDVIIGDARDEAVLRSLDVDSFDAVIVAMASVIEDSVLTTIMLKEMGAKLIICKANNEWHAKILTQLGADRIIHPESDMGRRVAQSLARQNIIDHLDISPEYGIVEMVAPKAWIGKSIVKNDLRRKYGITVVAIRSGISGMVDFSPSADRELHEGDILTIIGSERDLDKVSAIR